jgi:VWFA-related protein
VLAAAAVSLAPLALPPVRRVTPKALLVTVLDKAGAPIRNLEPAEFVVREDGERRRIVSARLASDPIAVALMVDTAKPIAGLPFPTQDLRRAISTFARILHAADPQAEIALYELAGAAVMTAPFTTRTADVETAVARLVPSQRSSSVLLEGLVDAARQLGAKSSPRRAIVSVTFASPEASTVHPRIVSDAVQQAGIAFWPVAIRGAESPSAFQAGANATDNAMAPTRELLFANLPDLTGGMRNTSVSATSLEALLGRIADILTAQYEVTYERPDGAVVKDIRAGATRGAKVLRAPWVR